mgnify:CR=1 FL=1
MLCAFLRLLGYLEEACLASYKQGLLLLVRFRFSLAWDLLTFVVVQACSSLIGSARGLVRISLSSRVCVLRSRYLGTPIIGDRLLLPPTDLDKHPPAKWGEGYKGNRIQAFPLPEEYSINGSTPLDKTEVSHITSVLRSGTTKYRGQKGPSKWQERLPVSHDTWKHLPSPHIHLATNHIKRLVHALPTHSSSTYRDP